MRRSVALLLLASLLVPGTGAQNGQPAPFAVVLEDPPGDVLLGPRAGGGVPAPYDEADLLQLEVREFPQEVILELKPKKMPEPMPVGPEVSTPINAYPTFVLEFSANQVAHHMFLNVDMTSGGYPTGEAKFYRGPRSATEPGGGGAEDLQPPAVFLDTRTGSYQVRIAKETMVFADLPMNRGTVLSDWKASGLLINPVGADLWIGDTMGPAASPFALAFGAEPSTVMMTSPSPFHISNGVASAYAYEVRLHPADGRAHKVTLDVVDAPAGWEFILPTATIATLADANTTAVIVAIVPFAHDHGTIEQFRLRATEGNVEVGGLQFGIVYTDVPQPSGHHDTLVVHSRAGGTVGYLNTIEDDPFDEGVPIPESRDMSSPLPDCYQWNLALEPTLAMGLDFDLSRTGTMELVFDTELGVFGDGLNGTLTVLPANGEAVIVADFQGTMDFRQEPLTSFTLNATVVPRQEADFVEAGPGSTLLMSFTIGGTTYCMGLEATPPKLHPGSRIQLPLRDFHAPVGDALEASTSWSIDAPESLLVRPGQATFLVADIENRANRDRELSVRIAGAWADAAKPFVVKVPAGATRAVTVPFVAPDLLSGDVAELLVTFEGDGLVAGFERVQLAFDDQAQPAQEEATKGGKRAPMPVLLPLTALAFSIMLAGRTPRRKS